MALNLTRRQFGLGLGAALLASPFVSLLGGRAARGASSGVARRLVVFFTPNGSVLSHWRPSGGERDFTFPAGSILEPLAPVKEHLTIIDGLDFFGASNHEGGMAAMLTGGGGGGENGGKSVDQYVAAQVGGATRFPSLEFGVQTSAWGGSVQTRMSYSGPGQYVPPDDDPLSIYKRLFGDLTGSPMQIDDRLRRRQSVLDLVKGDLAALTSRVGMEERAKLDQHLTALQQMERSLGTTGSSAASGGGSCTAPVAPGQVSIYDNELFPAVGKSQMDLLILALSCGLTNVASIQWAHTVAPQVLSAAGVHDGHHSLSHMDDSNAQGVADFVAAERWFASQFLYFVQQLAALPDPASGGSLLDSSLVLWCKELGDSRLHECKSVPFVIAGKGGGYLAPGRYLTFPHESHQKLLVSVCQAMGLQNQTFGDGSGGTGPLPGLAA